MGGVVMFIEFCGVFRGILGMVCMGGVVMFIEFCGMLCIEL